MGIQEGILGTLATNGADDNPPYGTVNCDNQIIAYTNETLKGGEAIYVQAPSTDITGQTISSIAVTSNVALVTTAAPHGLLAGGQVKLIGQTPSTFSGLYTIATVPSTTTFTIPLVVANSSATVVGTYTAAPITAGQVIENDYSVVSGVFTKRARVWDGTVNTGKNLAVAIRTVWASQWFWGKVQGLTIVQATGTIAVGAVYYSGIGAVRSTVTASKQVLGAEFVYAGVISNTAGFNIIFSEPTKRNASNQITLAVGAGRTLMYINRPIAQGAIT